MKLPDSYLLNSAHVVRILVNWMHTSSIGNLCNFCKLLTDKLQKNLIFLPFHTLASTGSPPYRAPPYRTFSYRTLIFLVWIYSIPYTFFATVHPKIGCFAIKTINVPIQIRNNCIFFLTFEPILAKQSKIHSFFSKME